MSADSFIKRHVDRTDGALRHGREHIYACTLLCVDIVQKLFCGTLIFNIKI